MCAVTEIISRAEADQKHKNVIEYIFLHNMHKQFGS